MPKSKSREADIAVGRRLAAAMAYRNVSLSKLAAESGLSRTTLWRYMKGSTAQPFSTVAVLARILSVGLDYLAYEEGPMIIGISHPVIEKE